MTRSAAVVIGIDAYASQPLTSAVNDARLFAKTLADLGMVNSGVRLLTAPSAEGAGDLPTRKGILDALRPYYTGEEAVDRLFFFYAGHGLLAYSDPARALPRTALAPVDMRDLTADGDILIDFDSIVTRLRFSGPAEQFFFVDACRDLGYADYPDMSTSLGWKAVPPGAERRQAILYAVPPLGKAQGERNGLGLMTQHLVDALHGRGIALDYSDDLRKYVVSAESVAAYVKKRVLEAVGPVPLWQRNYSLPRLEHREPQTDSMREVDQPEPAWLTLFIKPQQAEATTRVRLMQLEASVHTWPPNPYRQPSAVRPRRYWLETESDAGSPEPALLRIDAREEHEATIEIQPLVLGEPPDSAPPAGEPGPSEAGVVKTREAIRYLLPPPPLGRVVAEPLEPLATVELEQVDPPYRRWTAARRLNQGVPPGAYRIRFRLGPEVFSENEIDVPDRTLVRVTPSIESSPLIRELFGAQAAAQGEVTIAAAIGPMQAEILPTALSVIGIKPFDVRHELSGRFDAVVPHVDVSACGRRPVSLVLAVDGNRWPVPPAEVLSSFRASAERSGHAAEIPLLPLSEGFQEGRVALGAIAAPAASFTIRVRSPHTGAITVAAASLDRRVTVVTLIVRPDGSFGLSQNLLRIPGQHYDERVASIPYGRMLRDLQLGQRLYQGGELMERFGDSDLLIDLLNAKWTDPVLGCMAYFAAADSGVIGDDLLSRVARNLRRFFWDVTDARVIYGLAFPAGRDQLLSAALDHDDLPVLARSAAELARYAQERGSGDHAVTVLNRRVMPGQPWLASWQAEEPGAAARRFSAT